MIFDVLSVERIHRHGALVATAAIALDIGGVQLTIRGLPVLRRRDDSLVVKAPSFADPLFGGWAAAVSLPSALGDAIGFEIIEHLRTLPRGATPKAEQSAAEPVWASSRATYPLSDQL